MKTRVICVEAIKELQEGLKSQGKERKDTTGRMPDGWGRYACGDCSK